MRSCSVRASRRSRSLCASRNCCCCCCRPLVAASARVRRRDEQQQQQQREQLQWSPLRMATQIWSPGGGSDSVRPAKWGPRGSARPEARDKAALLCASCLQRSAYGHSARTASVGRTTTVEFSRIRPALSPGGCLCGGTKAPAFRCPGVRPELKLDGALGAESGELCSRAASSEVAAAVAAVAAVAFSGCASLKRSPLAAAAHKTRPGSSRPRPKSSQRRQQRQR